MLYFSPCRHDAAFAFAAYAIARAIRFAAACCLIFIFRHFLRQISPLSLRCFSDVYLPMFSMPPRLPDIAAAMMLAAAMPPAATPPPPLLLPAATPPFRLFCRWRADTSHLMPPPHCFRHDAFD